MLKNINPLHIFHKLLIKKNDNRNSIVKKNVVISAAFKIGTVLIQLINVPILINLLGQAKYGVWLTIASLINWIGFLDLGLGNGLRVKLSEEFLRKDRNNARIYISTTYAFVSIIVLLFSFIILFIIPYFNWNRILNFYNEKNIVLTKIIVIVIISFLLRFLSDLFKYILIADQKPYISRFLNFINNFIILLFLILFKKFNIHTLINIAFVFSFVPLIVGGGLSLNYFLRDYKKIVPSISLVRFSKIRDISDVGISFLIIQIAAIVLMSTDNVIISYLFGPKEVTSYNIAHKYFYLIVSIWSVLPMTLLPSYANAYFSKDLQWIKRKMKKIKILWGAITILLGLMVILSKVVYTIWVGDNIHIEYMISIIMAATVWVHLFGSIYAPLINGIGKLRIALMISILIAIINVPLSIFFAKYIFFNSAGVIFATFICLVISSSFYAFQSNLILKGRAKGIWNQ